MYVTFHLLSVAIEIAWRQKRWAWISVKSRVALKMGGITIKLQQHAQCIINNENMDAEEPVKTFVSTVEACWAHSGWSVRLTWEQLCRNSVIRPTRPARLHWRLQRLLVAETLMNSPRLARDRHVVELKQTSNKRLVWSLFDRYGLVCLYFASPSLYLLHYISILS